MILKEILKYKAHKKEKKMDDLALLREEIKTQSGKVPMAVLQGSVQMVIRWKDRAVHSVRVANNPTSSKRELEIALKEIKRTT